MNGQMDGHTGIYMDRRTDRYMNGQIDGRTYIYIYRQKAGQIARVI